MRIKEATYVEIISSQRNSISQEHILFYNWGDHWIEINGKFPLSDNAIKDGIENRRSQTSVRYVRKTQYVLNLMAAYKKDGDNDIDFNVEINVA